MERSYKPVRLFLCIVLFLAEIAFCITAFLGHTVSCSAAAVCFSAAAMLEVPPVYL